MVLDSGVSLVALDLIQCKYWKVRKQNP